MSSRSERTNGWSPPAREQLDHLAQLSYRAMRLPAFLTLLCARDGDRPSPCSVSLLISVHKEGGIIITALLGFRELPWLVLDPQRVSDTRQTWTSPLWDRRQSAEMGGPGTLSVVLKKSAKSSSNVFAVSHSRVQSRQGSYWPFSSLQLFISHEVIQQTNESQISSKNKTASQHLQNSSSPVLNHFSMYVRFLW